MASPSRAEELFAHYLARRDAGQAEPFESWAAGQDGLEAELHRLRAQWDGFQPVLERLLVSRTDEERAAQRLLGRLAERAPTGARFEPRGEIGAGGMGRVYRVFDPDLERELALKRTRDEGASATRERARTARFLFEARITGRLQHPGIVPVHELGLDGTGRVYYTMPLIEGEDLERLFERVRVREAGWSVPRVLAALQRVCETMAYAHSRGVVHGDLKPGNIRVGRFGEVYVMDWGLARLMDGTQPASGEEDERIAETNESGSGPSHVFGTPAYLAPELLEDARARLDPRTDVYAVGAMLYRLLTGRLPHEEELKDARDLEGTQAALRQPLVPVHTLARDVSPELQSIAERALAATPAERYPDMHSLAEDLRAFLEGRTVRAHATGPLVELQKWIGRNRAFAGALLALGASLLIGLFVSQAFYLEARRSEARVREERDRVLRLADVKRLTELVARAEELWPATPAFLAAYDEWLGEARRLGERLATHQATLLALRRSGRAAFADMEAQWEHDTLSELVDGLTEFTTPGTGLLAQVEARLAFASTVEERSRGSADARARWDEACRSIVDPRACPAYRGLRLRPQLGLVPLGRDPATGLWEFAHLASGELPRRDAGGKLVVDEASALVLVLLPGGSFLMGEQSEDPGLPNYCLNAFANEGPPHEVELAAFFLSKFELSQAQWQRAVGSNPSTYAPGNDEIEVTPLHPVETVGRGQCLAFARRLGLELPTEAQWEYAARAGTESPWWTGADPRSLQGAANLADRSVVRQGWQWPQIENELDDGFARHAPVDALRPNPFGLHHVLGNVWEWCRDDFGPYELPARSGDGLRVAPGQGMPIGRGGGYVNNAAFARVALRDSRSDSPHLLFGLRPSRPIDP